ncbi:MAG TPA: TraR/DksA C4-type zinc finger protein [Gemmataceae bacterium]|nr:TraR/DksA C4-type zinc finger protein [Gemmataceae bacterium]
MTTRDLKAFRRRLREMASRLDGEVTALEGEALGPPEETTGATLSGGSSLQGDEGMHEAEEELALTLLGAEADVLGEVTAALARIDQGTFGRCEECGKRITRTRLEALPYARHCIRCARQPGAGSNP